MALVNKKTSKIKKPPTKFSDERHMSWKDRDVKGQVEEKVKSGIIEEFDEQWKLNNFLPDIYMLIGWQIFGVYFKAQALRVVKGPETSSLKYKITRKEG